MPILDSSLLPGLIEHVAKYGAPPARRRLINYSLFGLQEPGSEPAPAPTEQSREPLLDYSLAPRSLERQRAPDFGPAPAPDKETIHAPQQLSEPSNKRMTQPSPTPSKPSVNLESLDFGYPYPNHPRR